MVALSVLFGALFLCVRPGDPHAVTGVSGAGASGAGGPGAASAVRGHGAHAVCVSPGELPGCSPFSHVARGVLPAPPPAVTLPGSAPPPVARTAGAGPSRPAGTLARAPDLHALQVLRT
ncbi:hypothetical protein ACFXA3_16320 [Streptomyces sp. NPDC059456]|uniref:hypothetical protein n=1 Tax=Streptomyces sp. NPDC059456 TaxID=3346838 RepID=UPI0036ABA458